MLVGPIPVSPQGARGIWARLSRNQRLGLGALVAAAVVLLVVFASLARTPDYGVAFSNLKDEDAAAIVAKLKEAKIPYELAERGTIKVPSGQVQEVRLLMASSGLVQKGSGVGFEIFNQPHFGLTEFAEKVNYHRALEGEISRSVNRLDAVESSRIHLVVPEQSLFTSQKKEPTAAAVLQLKPGRRLDPGQVQGISQLIAGSVEGLKIQNVTVMDATGAVLTDRQAENDPTRQSGNRSEIQRTLENRLADEVRTMLRPVVGPDRSVVRVNAELNWDQYESNSETFSPDGKTPQVRSRREISESSTQSTGAAGGVPGTDRNVPTYPGGQPNGAGQNGAERKDQTTNFELSRTIEKLTRAPGGIKRLNVAVALDSEVIADPAQADAISRLVATAAGLDTSRGDLVTLTSLPFSAADKKPAEIAEAARQREMSVSILRAVAMVLGPLMVVGLVGLILRRGRRPVERPRITIGAPIEQTQTALVEQDQIELPAPRQEDQEQVRVREELVSMAETDPAVVAQLIRTWMQEDRTK
jgi:flagellar M-ring protein FliF